MTGYGRGENIGGGRKWIVEIKSVNHRYLDISLRLPRNISLLEDNIRNVIKKKISRGRIDLFVKIQDEDAEKRNVKLDKELAKAYYSALGELADTLQISKEIKLMDIALMPDVLGYEETEEDLDLNWSFLQVALNEALEQLLEMRAKEGQELCKDLNKKISQLKETCSYIEEKAPVIVQEYEEKLTKKLNDALNGWEVDKNRILTEVAIMADKSSIDEEIVRFESHLKQLENDLMSKGSVGRKLDFLLQELNREINTIGSKSNNYEINNLVVEVKTNLEKMREQVQNIE